MPLQFVQDNTGSTTAVIIPIEVWKQITSKHQDLKQLEREQQFAAKGKMKPSDFAGALSEEGYKVINEHLKQATNEWDSKQ